MPGSDLLPEQEQLLCRIVEARNQLLPEREPFRYMRDHTTAADVAIFMHRGWPEDSDAPYLGDLDALGVAGYILRKSLVKGWEFDVTKKALDLYKSLRQQEGETAERDGVQVETASSAMSAPSPGSVDRPVFQKVGQK
ncbi:MAG: hypothetical protein ABIK85_10800 [Candidatus Eisenbacteria bacterium]